jgi:hypothetical protein
MIDKYFKGNNFWDVCPEFRAIGIFSDFYDTDKSKGHSDSSNIMWAIAFCLRRESPMYNLPNKWLLAGKDIALDEKIDWSKYDGLISMFKQSHLSQAEQSLFMWEELMAKRDLYLKTQQYFFDHIGEDGKLVRGTAEQLDRAFSATPKMYNDFYKIKKEIEDEDIKRGRGSKILSPSDTNEI